MIPEVGRDMSGESQDDIEKFVADQVADEKARNEIAPLTDEMINEAQRKAGERTEQGL